MTLEKALKQLLMDHPFYGLFMLGLNKQVVDDTHPIKTAAVALSGLNYTLYVNKTFWEKWNDKQQLGLLTHEILHIIFFHLTDTFKCDNHELMNIAQDQWSRYTVMYSCNC